MSREPESTEMRYPVVRTDWMTLTMRGPTEWVPLHIPVEEQAFELIRLGLLPLQMEDKWFIFFEDPVLHLHRSWTGYETFRILVSPSPEGRCIQGVLVSRDERECKYPEGAAAAHIALDTVAALLLGNSYEASDDVVNKWHGIGRALLGEGPVAGVSAAERKRLDDKWLASTQPDRSELFHPFL